MKCECLNSNSEPLTTPPRPSVTASARVRFQIACYTRGTCLAMNVGSWQRAAGSADGVKSESARLLPAAGCQPPATEHFMGTHRPTLIFAALIMACARVVLAQEPTAPPAHVAFVEGSATVEREGEVESLSSGMPLVGGDRLQTTVGRVELLFEGGSTLFLDESSTLDLLSPGSLRLLAGGLTFDVSPGRRTSAALYQVDTPAGSVFITADGEYTIVGKPDPQFFSTRVQVARGAADLITDHGRTSLTSGEESLVRSGEPPAFPVRFNSARWDSFGRWVESRRADRRFLSASRRYLPPAVQTYATTLDRYGSWVADAQFGIVWYPTVAGNWRPYGNGRWAWVAPFGWTWVGADAWGWPTDHYGRWCTNAGGNWFWIPGTVWGRAAPMILRQHGTSERARREPPHQFGQRQRSAMSSSVSPGLPSGRVGTPVRQDPLARPLPPIGLPLPTLGLPAPRQTTAPSASAFGTPSGGAWGAPRWTLAPPAAAPARAGAPRAQTAPPPPSNSRTGHGWGAAPMAVPPALRHAPPGAAPPRPQFGAWMAIPAAPQARPAP